VCSYLPGLSEGIPHHGRGSVAAAAHPRSTRHVDVRGESRVTDRRGYTSERRSGWVFDFFGRGNDDDYR